MAITAAMSANTKIFTFLSLLQPVMLYKQLDAPGGVACGGNTSETGKHRLAVVRYRLLSNTFRGVLWCAFHTRVALAQWNAFFVVRSDVLPFTPRAWLGDTACPCKFTTFASRVTSARHTGRW